MSHPQDRPPDGVETEEQIGDGHGLDLVDLVDGTFELKEVEVDLNFLEGQPEFDHVVSKGE